MRAFYKNINKQLKTLHNNTLIANNFLPYAFKPNLIVNYKLTLSNPSTNTISVLIIKRPVANQNFIIPKTQKPGNYQVFSFCSETGTRTPDTRIMIPLL